MSNKGKRFPPEPLSGEEVRAILRKIENARDRAAVIVMWRAGLRVAEVVGLTASDCDRGRGTLLVRNGKGNKSRTVGADSGTFDAIEEWLAERPPHRGDSKLFCTRNGKPLHPSHLRRVLKEAGDAAHLSKRAHPHGLRHTMACELLEEGVNVGIISRQLGHSSIATTHTYLNHVDATAVRDSMGGRDWKAA